jgi:RNA ligase (TIGR02306 family)
MIDSEFACEVVQIFGLRPHPNADRLELASIRMKTGVANYTVVVQKGTWKENDIAVYLSVDAVVPLHGPLSEPFHFLRDSKGQRVSHRIRAARLRGVYSEGLLIPAPYVAPLGTDMSEQLRVTQYQPKASVAFPGPVNSPRRKTRLEHLVPEYSLTSLKKAPFTFEHGEQVRVTEKIHGTNFRFGWVKGRFVVGSHRTWKTDTRNLWERFRDWVLRVPPKGPGFYGEDLWLQAATQYQLEVATEDYQGVIFYGELFGRTPSGKAIQDLHYGGGTLQFRLFDAYDTRAGIWYNDAQLAVAAADMGLQIAPELYRGPFDLDLVKQMAEGSTTLPGKWPTHIREGVVVEALTGDRRKGKYVGEGYLTRKEG